MASVPLAASSLPNDIGATGVDASSSTGLSSIRRAGVGLNVEGPPTTGQTRVAQDSPSPPRTPRGTGSCTPVRLQSGVAKEYKPGSATPIRNYEKDASIAFVGFRGTGMSSLAVMASTALGFRLIDADQHFYQATSLSRGAYRSTHGVVEYKQEELRQLRAILSENPTKTVIVCGPGVIEGTGQSLLSEYANAHPVIYILRDTEGIQKHLSVWDASTTAHFVRLSCPIHRSLSSYEFYNLDGTSFFTPDNGTSRGQQSPQTLALKKVEEDFLQLLRNITERPEDRREHETRYGLESLPLEVRPYSYALSLRMAASDEDEMDIQDIDTSADAVEFLIPAKGVLEPGVCLDHSVASNVSRQYYTIRRYIRLPIIFHVENSFLHDSKSTGDGSTISEQLYFDALHHGLRLTPEYLTVDLSYDEQTIRQLIAAKGSTKIIGHYFDHNPGVAGWSKPDRRAMVTRAEELGCDVVRVCQLAIGMEDNFAVRTFVQEMKVLKGCRIPLIAYNTGPLGRMSHFLNPTLTPVSHSALRSRAHEWPPASLLTINEAQTALYASFALDPMKFGIYGSNVSESLSPAMHNAAFGQCGMPHTYQAYNYPTLRELEALIRDPSFGGVSITAPFKRDIIPFVDRMSREARAIGAINTVLPLRSANANPLLDSNRNGHVVALYGENTDWIGIHTCIRRNLSPINAVRRRTAGLIVGAGGMARAAAYAMVRLGVRNIYVYSRSAINAAELARQFHGRSFTDTSSESESQDTSQGMELLNDNAPSVIVLHSKDDPWPTDADYPTIIVSSVPHSVDGKPMADNTLPASWLASPTGGVIIEGWIAVDGLQVLPEQGTVQFDILFTYSIVTTFVRLYPLSIHMGTAPGTNGTVEDASTIPKRSFYIFGHNIKHSLSPALHNAGFKAYGLPHFYSIHESPSVDSSVEEIIARPDFGGASVTFPHKLQIDRLLDSLNEGARRVGAVNTIIVRQAADGRRLLVGDNTDWLGIQKCIRRGGLVGLSSSPALIVGAGGAARAACYALQEDGYQDVVVVNRTIEKAKQMAANFPKLHVRIYETLEEASFAVAGAFRVIVACTPADDLGEDKIPAGLFLGSESAVLIEMAYRPQVTGMMKVAGRYPGWKIYRGVDVLEEQAYSQFEYWTQRPAPVKVMREAMLAQAH
ncbi:hypothetical protein GQ53DRAFT_663283 [Thozetella sp. PMI_491]|nr:hypothetical protein GQ53DRAFT_663283 [Thozetella sp. PMI_491]